jgi:hypothetical protein
MTPGMAGCKEDRAVDRTQPPPDASPVAPSTATAPLPSLVQTGAAQPDTTESAPPPVAVPTSTSGPDAGYSYQVRPHSTAYRVVDPLPPPPRDRICNPPYTYDSNGVKHYKKECL